MAASAKKAETPSVLQDVRAAIGISDRQTVGLSDFSWKNFKAVGKETLVAIFDRKLLTLAAGTAYYVTLALIPTLAAALAIASRALSEHDLLQVLTVSNRFLPDELARFIEAQLPGLVRGEPHSLLVIALMVGFALLMASNAIDNLMNALNAAFNLKELRTPVRFKLTSLALGFTVVVLLILNGILLLVSTQAWQQQTDTNWLATALMNIARFFLVFILTSLTVTLLYRFGPHHKNPRTSWVTWGALMASVGWFLVSLLFFFYIQYLVDFTQVFGVLAGIFVLMAWIELSCITLVLGAAINGNLTKQAERLYKEKS